MTRDIFITITGRQLGIEEEPVIMTADGAYRLANGKHYIQYDEKFENSEAVQKNIIKISSSEIVLTKKGVQNSQMVFNLNETTQTVYQTPYGNITLEVITKAIELIEISYKINVKLIYSLFTEGALLSDNELAISILEG